VLVTEGRDEIALRFEADRIEQASVDRYRRELVEA
jgi:hypothetical protein